MALVDTLISDIRVVADYLDALDRQLSYDEFVAEIAAVAPASSDIHWMADNQLVGIFFARQTASPALLTSRLREWLA
jgi:hypothetical protein